MKRLFFLLLFASIPLYGQSTKCCDSAVLKSGCPPGVPICQPTKHPLPPTPIVKPPTVGITKSPVPPITLVPHTPAPVQTAPVRSTASPVPPSASGSPSVKPPTGPTATKPGLSPFLLIGGILLVVGGVVFLALKSKPKPPTVTGG